MASRSVPGADIVVDDALHQFLTTEVLPSIEVPTDVFYGGLAEAMRTLAPRNRVLLETRERMQDAIDQWHLTHGGTGAPDAYQRFLAELGYLLPRGGEFAITTADVDEEIAVVSAPQLVVPMTNARYVLNAVNARWGSLYDALYGTDAMGSNPPSGPYDAARGAAVIAWARSFLDDAVPLEDGSHGDCTRYSVAEGRLVAELVGGRATGLRDPAALLGHVGSAGDPASIVLENHRLKIEIRIDRTHPVGAADSAGVADVLLEAAVTAIMDLEDSVATVDPDDKVAAYRNWLGLMNGSLETNVDKQGSSFVRRANEDRAFTAVDGSQARLRARALLLVRTVGHLMTTTAVLDRDGHPIPEGILDTFVVAAAALHDGTRPAPERNSRFGSVYIVKPKMHGPDEVAFTCDLFAVVERTLGMAPDTLKVGIMDEERRTTLNLHECIRAAAGRVVFVNTGFLDRTGDEIHTSMNAGPMVRKADMKSATWIRAYEDWNVDTGLACGFAGRAQIGKGMWAMPDRMGEMLDQKLGHPLAGANCAWVPSPTAATLHATHYHRVDVVARQRELAGQRRVDLEELLTIPVAPEVSWTADERQHELDNNVQGILGYVVRWVDQGVGCSKVPDISGVALMEDRATCRISSQHVANWLLHRVVSADEVEASLVRMASVVDDQNAGDPQYTPMAPDLSGPAFEAARDLIFGGTRSPSGYTEPTLHARRLERKRAEQG